MPSFTYVARAATDGKRVEGTVHAESERQALDTLDRMGVLPVEVREARPRGLSVAGRGRVPRRHVTAMFRQLGDLLRVGVPITRALQTLGGERSGELPRLMDAIRTEVTAGTPLSDALARHPRHFGDLEVGMVRAGEAGGFLDEALSRVARFRERDEELRGRIKAAMAYPVLLSVLGIGAVVYLMVFFIPRFTEIFRNMGEALPWPTRLLIAVSNALASHGLLILLGLIVAGFLVGRALATEGGRLWRDRTLLRLPGLGAVLRRSALARCCRVLGTLLKSGVPILEALGIVRDAVGNRVVARALDQAQTGVREGRALGQPLRDTGEFPATLCDMVEVGEEAGNLEAVLLDASDAFDTDVDRAVKVFVSLLEPAMLIVMGGLVGFIVIAMLLPIFTMNSVMR